MKRLLLILIVTFSFQTWTKADDIRDFQIEGMSLGDSLLDFFSLEEIKSFKAYFYNDKEYKALQTNLEPKNYDGIDVAVKDGDRDYIIYQIVGGIYYEENIDNCYIKQKKILSELKDIFSNNVKKNSYTKKHAADITGNSSNTTTQFEFKSKDVVRVSCYDWGKQIEDERGYTDNLRVTIVEANFRNWVNTKAHE